MPKKTQEADPSGDSIRRMSFVTIALYFIARRS
jgi:hypothetical protein